MSLLTEVGLCFDILSFYCNDPAGELGNSSELFCKDNLPSVLSALKCSFSSYSGQFDLVGGSEGEAAQATTAEGPWGQLPHPHMG